MRRITLPALLVAAAIAGSTPSAADGRRAPKPRERTQIVRAIAKTVKASPNIARFRVTGISISTVNADYAGVGVRIWDRRGGELQPFSALLVHGYSGAWYSLSEGTADVGCDIAPRKVLTDLDFTCSQ